VARAVKIAAGGSLTLVSGFLATRPSKTSVLQGAINAALESLGRGLALELSPVRVNTVSPGMVATPLWSGSDEARAAKFEAVRHACRRSASGSGRCGQCHRLSGHDAIRHRLHGAGGWRRRDRLGSGIERELGEGGLAGGALVLPLVGLGQFAVRAIIQ
jgi:NAD(P)-dependent dehydrogenase (short-subunit alcohol dehydrogenase family)